MVPRPAAEVAARNVLIYRQIEVLGALYGQGVAGVVLTRGVFDSSLRQGRAAEGQHESYPQKGARSEVSNRSELPLVLWHFY